MEEKVDIVALGELLIDFMYAGVWTKYEMVRKKRTGEKDG